MGVLALFATHALAQASDATTNLQATGTLPEAVVYGTKSNSLTSQSTQAQKRELQQTVGSVGFVDSDAYANTYAFTLRDVLKDVPGVFVQDRYGQELRLSKPATRAPSGLPTARRSCLMTAGSTLIRGSSTRTSTTRFSR